VGSSARIVLGNTDHGSGTIEKDVVDNEDEKKGKRGVFQW
jgi:hypothetical protein